MAGARTSTRAATRSSPRSSPQSTRSTPRAARPTPLKKSSTPRTPTAAKAKAGARGVNKGKTSPYFSKTKGKVEADDDAEDSDEGGKALLHDATGMTDTEDDETSSESGVSEDEFAPSSAEEDAEEVAEESEDIDSDVDSDDIDDEDVKPKKGGAKRKSTGTSGGSAKKKIKSGNGTGGGRSNGKHDGIDGYEDEDEDDEEIELEEGQEIAGRIYPAPKTGQGELALLSVHGSTRRRLMAVPPGRISQNTLNFLKNMQIPERNDREWFRSHEPAFRQAEKEWKAFVGIVQGRFRSADPQVPILPPNQVIHRIYRDVRFSSDKTPYKKSFSLSTSRGGRKGIWAGYHLSISPNNRSILAAGVWQPGKDELASIRHRFLTEPQTFRDVISAPAFVDMFGPAKPDKNGQRQNVFGHDDALKVAPKGVDKTHKDIDILKLRSVAVVHHFTDEEVIATDFQAKVEGVVAVMAPFVHLLNDFISLPPAGGETEDQANGSEGEA